MEFGLVAGLIALVFNSQGDSSALYLLAALFVLVVILLTSLFVQLPIEVGVIRHLWQVQHDQATFDGRMALRLGLPPKNDVVRPLLTSIIVGGSVAVGLFFMFISGFFLAMALTFALPACVIGKKGPIDAITYALKHTRRHPAWRVRLALGLFVILVGASSIPFLGQLVGPPFATLLLLRAYDSSSRLDDEDSASSST
ncbi:MAG: hypothetical protein GY822_20065 [Deltaproteobacteria bacterium]|nr:hypothetical protein [Deltaproteobacteria bacterium]